MTNLSKQRFRSWDPWLLIPMIALSILGIIMVYSASAGLNYVGGSAKSYLVKQTIYVLLGLTAFFLVANLDLRRLRNPKFLAYSYGILLLALIFVKVFGASINGAQGWIRIGNLFSIQPAEVCKLFIILYLSDRLARYEERPGRYSRLGLYGPLCFCLLLILVILLEPDLGGAAINTAIVGVILLSARMPWRRGVAILVGVVSCLIIGMPMIAQLALKFFHGYKAARFIGYLNPFGSAAGAGSQLVNSYYAISNGGLFGKGLGNSIQKLGYLPEPNTDFILAVVAEELGLIWVTLIMVALAFLVCHIIQIGARCRSSYQTFLCYGSATFICVEAAFNIGAVCGVLPITGVTLPFISYGGSSLLVLCTTLGLVMNVSRQQRLARALPATEEAS